MNLKESTKDIDFIIPEEKEFTYLVVPFIINVTYNLLTFS